MTERRSGGGVGPSEPGENLTRVITRALDAIARTRGIDRGDTKALAREVRRAAREMSASDKAAMMARENRRTRLRELAAPVALAATVHGVGSPEHTEARRALDAALGVIEGLLDALEREAADR